MVAEGHYQCPKTKTKSFENFKVNDGRVEIISSNSFCSQVCAVRLVSVFLLAFALLWR